MELLASAAVAAETDAMRDSRFEPNRFVLRSYAAMVRQGRPSARLRLVGHPIKVVIAAPDVYRADQWQDFFVMAGTGAAALTGLVFVAMSLNVGAIKGDTAHRYRASGSLTGLASVFVLSGLVLMGGQHHQAVGAEVIIVAVVTATFFVWRFLHTRRFRGGDSALGIYRSLGSTICYLVEIGGAAVVIGGDSFGLYLIAVGIMVNFYFMISGAWLLFVGAEGPDQP